MDQQNNQAHSEGVEVESPSVLATLNSSEINVQITTAKAYPRSLQAFQRDALTLATLDQETARSMFYVVPRDGRNIEGPSVRLAEIVGSSWGNLRYGARVVDIDESFVTAQGMAFDLEKNLASTIEVRRQIKTKYGKRYSDDMIRTTANAAMSIALRNAIFKVVPFALVKKVYEQAKEVSLGKGLSMEKRRENALKALGSIGAKPADIYRLCNRRGLDDLTVDDLINLNGLYTAIKEGDTTWAEVLDGLPKTEEEIGAKVSRDFATKVDDVEVVGDSPRARGTAQSASRRESAIPPTGSKPAASTSSAPPPQPATGTKPSGPSPASPDAQIPDETADDLYEQAAMAGMKQSAFKKHVKDGYGVAVDQLTNAQAVELSKALQALFAGGQG